MFKAKATVNARGRQWDMTISDLYETKEQAMAGITRFRRYARGKATIIKTWIEES